MFYLIIMVCTVGLQCDQPMVVSKHPNMDDCEKRLEVEYLKIEKDESSKDGTALMCIKRDALPADIKWKELTT